MSDTDCAIITYTPLIISGGLLIISEILPFIPDKYVKAKGILQLIVQTGQKILTFIPTPTKTTAVANV